MTEKWQQDKERDIRRAYNFLRANNSSIPDDVLDLMRDAALEALKIEENPNPVSPEDYVDALVERKDRMDDARLGAFVKKTLWTVIGKDK